MTRTIQLRALRPFPYGKNRLAVGEIFDVDEKFGAVLLAEKRAAHLEQASPVDLPPEVMQRSSRREPIAEVEDAPAPAAVEEVAKVEDAPVAKKAMKAEAVEEDKAPKSKQAYHRRDMVAETPKEQPAKTPGRRGRPKKSQS